MHRESEWIERVSGCEWIERRVSVWIESEGECVDRERVCGG